MAAPRGWDDALDKAKKSISIPDIAAQSRKDYRGLRRASRHYYEDLLDQRRDRILDDYGKRQRDAEKQLSQLSSSANSTLERLSFLYHFTGLILDFAHETENGSAWAVDCDPPDLVSDAVSSVKEQWMKFIEGCRVEDGTDHLIFVLSRAGLSVSHHDIDDSCDVSDDDFEGFRPPPGFATVAGLIDALKDRVSSHLLHSLNIARLRIMFLHSDHAHAHESLAQEITRMMHCRCLHNLMHCGWGVNVAPGEASVDNAFIQSVLDDTGTVLKCIRGGPQGNSKLVSISVPPHTTTRRFTNKQQLLVDLQELGQNSQCLCGTFVSQPMTRAELQLLCDGTFGASDHFEFSVSAAIARAVSADAWEAAGAIESSSHMLYEIDRIQEFLQNGAISQKRRSILSKNVISKFQVLAGGDESCSMPQSSSFDAHRLCNMLLDNFDCGDSIQVELCQKLVAMSEYVPGGLMSRVNDIMISVVDVSTSFEDARSYIHFGHSKRRRLEKPDAGSGELDVVGGGRLTMDFFYDHVPCERLSERQLTILSAKAYGDLESFDVVKLAAVCRFIEYVGKERCSKHFELIEQVYTHRFKIVEAATRCHDACEFNRLMALAAVLPNDCRFFIAEQAMLCGCADGRGELLKDAGNVIADMLRNGDALKFIEDMSSMIWLVVRSRNVCDASIFVAQLVGIAPEADEQAVEAAVKATSSDVMRIVLAVHSCSELYYGNRKLSLEEQSHWKLWLDMVVARCKASLRVP